VVTNVVCYAKPSSSFIFHRWEFVGWVKVINPFIKTKLEKG